jgi:radical SAM superfamily enzyme YgiQ (UPF0313 family)
LAAVVTIFAAPPLTDWTQRTMPPKLLLVTPPLVQLNTPYPATCVLTAAMRRRGVPTVQADAGLALVLRLVSSTGVQRILDALAATPKGTRARPAVAHLREHGAAYVRLADRVVALLQGRDASLVHRIAARRLLPEGPRFAGLGPPGQEQEYLDWAFGSLGTSDRARTFATLFVEEVCDAVAQGLDPHFSLARYGESLARRLPRIDPLLEELAHPERLTAQLLREVTVELLEAHSPDVVGITVPFPGTVLGALRMARTIREVRPQTRVVWGGGWVNTELRELREPALFDYVDAVSYDDGEQPLACLLEHFAGRRARSGLLRARTRERGEVVWSSTPDEQDAPFRAAATPTYDGLPLADYLGLIDQLNPMNRLWSDTRWNKLAVAHGCYWRQCTFCDTSLDYIKRYEPLDARVLVDQIETLIGETGARGFHFVDEAAPPKVLRAMCQELRRRGVDISFWGNIRFEKAFTRELCQLLARAGCIAVSGGLEAAHDRLLGLVNKGITVAQVARVTRAFQDAGIRVHAYLIYGFPTETAQETIDSLEYVRQLFAAGCLDSAFWHRLAVTAHAPLGLAPERFGIRLAPAGPITFARNELAFEDPTGVDHDLLGGGLHRAVYNYSHGLGMDEEVHRWFGARVPWPTVPADFIARALAKAQTTDKEKRGREHATKYLEKKSRK